MPRGVYPRTERHKGFWAIPGKLERLKELWAAGVPVRKMAAELGCSPGAVVAKRDRLGLPMRDSKIARLRGRRHNNFGSLTGGINSKPPLDTIARTRRQRLAKRSLEVAGHVDVSAAGAAGHELVALADLEAHHCRWPIGMPSTPGFGFCGQRHVPGQSYCKGHLEASVAKGSERAAALRELRSSRAADMRALAAEVREQQQRVAGELLENA